MPDVLFFRGANKIHVLDVAEGKTACGKPWVKPKRTSHATKVCAVCSKRLKAN
jgi:hypothetical protein